MLVQTQFGQVLFPLYFPAAREYPAGALGYACQEPNARQKMRLLQVLLILVLPGAAHAGGDPEHGLALYRTQCMSCHSVDYNGVGPAHKGVFGRRAGSLANYNYSPALKAAGLVWSESTLDKWLRDPEQLVPGQKMGVMVQSAQDRADLIAYLKTLNP
jgi:cytochrome c